MNNTPTAPVCLLAIGLFACHNTLAERLPPVFSEAIPANEKHCTEQKKPKKKKQKALNAGLLVPTPSSNVLKRAIQSHFRQQLSSVDQPNHLAIKRTTALEAPAVASTPSTDAAGGDNFSQTNNQVAGVDESDTIKFSGSHFFIADNGKIRVVNAGRSSDNLTEKLGYFSLDKPPSALSNNTDEPEIEGTPQIEPTRLIAPGYLPYAPKAELHLSESNLVALTSSPTPYFILPVIRPAASLTNGSRVIAPPPNRPEFHVQGFTQLSDKLDQLDPERDIPSDWSISLQGNLINSRRIEDSLYVVSRFRLQLPTIRPYNTYLKNKITSTEQADSKSLKREQKAIINSLNLNDILPKVTISQGHIGSPHLPKVQVPKRCYLHKDQKGVNELTYLSKINMSTGEITSQCVGAATQGIYVSRERLFLFNTNYNYFSFAQAITESQNSIDIHAFALNDTLDYLGSGSVSGNLQCNPARYCMGELADGTLGIVTSGGSWDDPKHQLSILAHDTPSRRGKRQLHAWSVRAQLPNKQRPEPIGKPGERLYSVRFMQNRAYLVTFQKVDPLYVIDLANTDQPQILGELEIPGYSDYLHPVGDDLLIGVGKSALTGESGTTWYQGVQVSLFDVSTPTAPKALTQLSVGKRGTQTAVQYSPKSFNGFEKEGDFWFALPVRLHDGEASGNVWRDPESQFYDFTHNGLHLFRINDLASFQSDRSTQPQLSEMSQHFTQAEQCNNQNYYYSGTPPRSFFKGEDVFYMCNGQLWLSPIDDATIIQGSF